LLAWTTAALFATLPAYAAATVDPLDLIRGTARQGASRPVRLMRTALITAQMLLAVVMLTGAGLLIRSFANVVSLPLGFDPRDLVVASVAITDRDQDSREDEREFARRMDEALRARLGALPLAFGSLPQGFTGAGTRPWMFGTGAWDHNVAFSSEIRRVTAGSFEMLGQAIRRGRSFDRTDGPVAPRVAIVNEAFVRRHAEGQDVIGRPIRTTGEVHTIVGVADDVRMSRMTLAPRDAVYVPLEQDPTNGLSIAVRTPRQAIVDRALRDVIRQLDPDMPLLGVASVDDRLAQGEARRRFYLATVVVFGALAGTIAAFGVYGVTAHVTRLRRRELAIRLALGARSVSLKAIVLRQGLWPAALGVAAGIVAAGWMTQLLHANPVFRSQLYQVTPRDPWTFALAAIGLLVIAALACWLPARAVDGLEPVSVLKSE
jgi:predicted permease